MADLVDIALPTNGQKAAEALGLQTQRNVTTGVWVRHISRDEAEIAVDCLLDWGITARIVDEPRDAPPFDPGARRAA